MKIAFLCENCGAQINDDDPVYQVREARVIHHRIIYNDSRPAALICEKCFEKFMEATHEQRAKAYVKCPIKGGKT